MIETTSNTYPYSLEVTPIRGSDRDFQWTIRKHGKLYQRSDRKHSSEAKAREDGLSVIEKLLGGADDGHR